MNLALRAPLAILAAALAACTTTANNTPSHTAPQTAPQTAQQPAAQATQQAPPQTAQQPAQNGTAVTTPAGASAAAAPARATPAQTAPFEKNGIVTPSNYAPITIWPEQFAGQLLVLEVKPHGSPVEADEVIARFDTRTIDDELHRAELEAQSAAIRHQGVVEKNRIDKDAGQSSLELAKSGLDRAQRSLEGWKKFELAYAKRNDDISKRREQANVEDETDELDQLQKMYKADALVDATEDIVIKRALRSLDLTKSSNQLSRERSTYREAYDLALQTEQREEQVRTQVDALARLSRQLAIDERARQDAEFRSADTLREQREKVEKLQRDAARFVVHAPRAGVILHGAAKDYRPGRTPLRVERGGTLAFRQDLFIVADPTPSTLALDLASADLAKLADGAKVNVQAIGAPTSSTKGSLRVETYPRSSSPTDATYDASVTLDASLPGAVYGAYAKVSSDAPVKADT